PAVDLTECGQHLDHPAPGGGATPPTRDAFFSPSGEYPDDYRPCTTADTPARLAVPRGAAGSDRGRPRRVGRSQPAVSPRGSVSAAPAGVLRWDPAPDDPRLGGTVPGCRGPLWLRVYRSLTSYDRARESHPQSVRGRPTPLG